MQGEAARGRNLGPRRAPEPPVATRRLRSDAPDPGAVSGRLPPFRAGSTDAPRTDTTEGREPAVDALGPTPDVELEPIADVLLESAEVSLGSTMDVPAEPAQEDGGPEPVADLLPELEPQSELDPSIAAYEAGRADQAEHVTDAEIEEAWFLDEIVDADDEPGDPLGEALQEAVTRAAPPFAEDLVRSAERMDRAVIEDSPETPPPPDSSTQRADVGRADPEVAGVLDRLSTVKPSADGFTEDLATTLEALASSLRARGFNALEDAFSRGDRLESSLALFLAGYRAGRGE